MSNPKYPRYVAIYDALLSDIQTGRYPAGEQLPGENELARQFGVSRNTLRQAIMLLNEDGYITMKQGKGTFVLRNHVGQREGLEKLINPLKTFAVEPVSAIETKFEIRNISPKNQAVFNLDPSKLLVLVETVYFSGEACVGCGLSFIPYDAFSERQIPLDDMDKVRDFYEELIAREALETESSLRIVNAREPVTKLMGISPQETLLMLDEIVRGKSGAVLLTQKLFFLPGAYELTFSRRNDRNGGAKTK